jgi:hypothetical protein
MLGLAVRRQPPRFLVVLTAPHKSIRAGPPLKRRFWNDPTGAIMVCAVGPVAQAAVATVTFYVYRQKHHFSKDQWLIRAIRLCLITGGSKDSRSERATAGNRKSCTQYLVKVVSVNILWPTRLAAMKGDFVG